MFSSKAHASDLTNQAPSLLVFLTLLALTLTLAASCARRPPAPSPTPVTTPVSISIPVSKLPVLAGTPVPRPREPITADNASRVTELAMWGKGRIRQVLFSPDGRLLAVGTAAGIWLYDAQTLKELGFIRTDSWVDALVFAPNSTTLMAEMGTTTLVTWDLDTGKVVRSLKVREGYHGNSNFSPGQVAFSLDGTTLVAMTDEWRVGVWDVRDARLLRVVDTDESVSSLAISSDGTLLASVAGYGDTTVAKLWDVKKGTLLRTLNYSFGSDAAISPDGRVLALDAADKTVQLRSVETGAIRHTLRVSTNDVREMTFSLDGKLLAVGEMQGNVQVWDVATETLVRTLSGHKAWIISLAFSPDRKRLVSGFSDGTVYLWDIEADKLLGTLEGYWPDATELAFSPDGIKVFLSPAFGLYYGAEGAKREIQRWEVGTGQVERMPTEYGTDVSLSFSADGTRLASNADATKEGYEKTLIWDVKTGQRLQSLRPGKYVALSPDGKKVVVAPPRAKWATVFDVQTGKELYMVGGIFMSRILTFSPDGTRLASASLSTLYLHDAETGKEMYKTKMPGRAQVGRMWDPPTFSPDGKLIAVGSENGVIWLYRADTGQLAQTLTGPGGDVIGLAFSPDGTLLASGTQSTENVLGALQPTIQLWDVRTGTLLHSVAGYMPNVNRLAFSADGVFLASASSDGTVRLWGVPSAE